MFTGEIHPKPWIYERLICEFSHWDRCLTGLIEHDGQKLICHIDNQNEVEEGLGPAMYSLHSLDWTPECDEYLTDYQKAYHHWFHTNGQRPAYDGRDLGWFSLKWNHKNPIVTGAGIPWRV